MQMGSEAGHGQGTGDAMNNEMDLMVRKPTDIREASPRTNGVTELEVDVVFTTFEGTLAALEKASELSRDLETGIRLLVPQVVPYIYAIDRPPVDAGFLRRKMIDLVLQGVSGGAKTTIDLYFCRDRLRTLLSVLKPNSLVVVGGRRRWWATDESRLSKALRNNGHQVVSIDLN